MQAVELVAVLLMEQVLVAVELDQMGLLELAVELVDHLAE